jgi:hypothetical protein
MRVSLVRKLIIAFAVLGLLTSCTTTNVVENERVSPGRHPNLAEAQRLIERARDKIADAQRVHDFDLNGHAKRAKELLDEAYTEINLAALAADENR